MPLHDNPQELIEQLVVQHSQVLSELHGDLIARLGEVDDRFVDQDDTPRRISVSAILLETVLMSRRRRQSEESTLQCKGSNGFSILLYDGRGTEIRVRRHPTGPDGELLPLSTYQPGGMQMSFDDELGAPIVDESYEGPIAPSGYRLYVLWWPGSLALGGAVLAAGVLTKYDEILYATTPLPSPVMEERTTSTGMAGAVAGSVPTIAAALTTPPRRRRSDEDFADVSGADEHTGSADPS